MSTLTRARKSGKPENNLRSWLVTSKLFFLPKGRVHKNFIYTYIETILPELCTSTEVKYAGQRTVWQHAVDFALSDLKKLGVIKQSARDAGTGYYQIK
jgi:hypothetical protein